MPNYKQIVRLAHKQGIKLKESTLRKDFCLQGIKPEKHGGCNPAEFSEEVVNEYLDGKKLKRAGRPWPAKNK